MTDKASPILHVTFSPAIPRSVGGALAMIGRDEPVIGLVDAFNYGPINPPDQRARSMDAHGIWPRVRC